MHELAILDRTGHTSVEWTTDNPATVGTATEKFGELLGQGYTAYKINKGEEASKGEPITKFDQEAERIVLVPKMVGGAH